MNTLKNLTKKAIAIGTGAVITAATIAGAAADLSAYPAPFVTNGQFNGLIVVGEKAATADVLGSIEIASSLQAASTTVVTGGAGSTVTVSGDAKQIGDSSDMLEAGEFIGDVTETLTDDDLEFLKGGVISTDGGDTDFVQTIEFDGLTRADTDSHTVGLFENNEDEIGAFYFFNDGDQVFRYELEFTSGLESEIDTGVLVDLEDESLFILGQYFNVISTDVDTAADDLTIELMSGDVTDTLSEGDTKTYTIDGKEYEITVLFVSDSGSGAAKFLVNGETTDSLEAGDTDKVAGIELGVREVLSQSRGTTGGTLVEFYVGANKMEFTDNDYTNAIADGSVKINSETLTDATIVMQATESGTDLVINKMTYTFESDAADDQDVYLEKGQGLRMFLDEPEGMLADGWDIRFEGLTTPDMTELRFDAKGDDEYELVFTNRRGDEYSVPYAHATGASVADWGNEDEKLVFWEADQDADGTPEVALDYLIELDDFFVVTDTSGGAAAVDNGDDSFVLQFVDVDEGENTISFRDASSGSDIKATVADADAGTFAAPQTGDFTIGGKDFDFWLADDGTDYFVAVDLDNNGTVSNLTVAPIVIKGGGILNLATAGDVATISGGTWTSTLTTQSDDFDEASIDQVTNIVFIVDASSELDVAAPAFSSGGYFNSETDSDADITYTLDLYGVTSETTDEDNEADSVSIMYPMQQVQALVYVTGGDIQTTETASGSGVRVNPIRVGSAVLDSDVDYDQANMIVIGGPCANTAAAALLGNPADCAEGFTAGNAIIKYFDTGSNVAILVAGYESQETQGASRVLAQYDDYELMGDEVEVTVTSLTQSGIRVN